MPVVLFPGNLLQLTIKADIILLLSLISGRNPELLIGNHVIAAPFLKDVREKVVSVGYILISCGTKTSVEYISQTEAIPADKPEIAVATALAGEMLGMGMIYLEAGSGAIIRYLSVLSKLSGRIFPFLLQLVEESEIRSRLRKPLKQEPI